MEINWTGAAAALATFVGVWLGHVIVRAVEARVVSLRLPIAVCIGLGFGLEIASLFTRSAPAAAALGILGLTSLWDALEFFRQEKRVKTGRAPANPANPRHARILAVCPAAGTVNWLKREPRGRAYSEEERNAIRHTESRNP